ncbi:hypothetical protein GGI25_004046 [Coemansia spiralis]|uniref:Ion transport domain-containing protein n=2 Tax=Coemansia TaxID=4863 RepID=A0A9W8G558_9FUNG|nr:hypothetical protein GGI25_004046 [Coemansia spiralis]
MGASIHQQNHSSISPLHQPRFPIPAEHRTNTAASYASTSHSRYVALALQSPGDTSVIELSHIGRPGPLRNLPSDLYTDGSTLVNGNSDNRNGDHVNKSEKPAASSGNAGGAASAMEQAAVAAVATATPPAVDEDQWYREQIDYVRTQVEQMENMELQRGQEAKSIRSKWKRNLFLLFEDPSSSPSAFIINVFVTFMIIFSAILTTIETIPALRKGNSHVWLALELTIVAIFTIEFILRFLGHTDSWRQAWNHTKSLITLIDALAIFPFYIELIFRRDTSYEFRFTILRIFRLLRVFSAFKYSSLLQLSIEVMIIAIKRSADALLAFLLFVTLTVLLFSTLMYFAERGTWDEERQAFLNSDGEYSKFSSIPAAAYYSIVTLTTTGFGDMVPTTFIGKLVSFPMMIAGILLIALPSIIVGRNFTQVWDAARKYRLQRSNVRVQRIGESLIEDEQDECHSSGRNSRRSRRQRLRNRGTGSRRNGSISSFESGPPQSIVKSPMDTSGGYATVSGGQKEFSDDDTNVQDYARRSDPIDALARKDSIEMQELASRPAEPEERPDGYTQVETLYEQESDYGSENEADSASSDNSKWTDRYSNRAQVQPKRRPLHKRKPTSRSINRGKGKERAGYEDNGGEGTGLGNRQEDVIQVSRLEWESLNAELAALRSVIGSNGQILRAIATHLAVPNLSSVSTQLSPNATADNGLGSTPRYLAVTEAITQLRTEETAAVHSGSEH